MTVTDDEPSPDGSIAEIPGVLRRIADLIEAAIAMEPLADSTTALGLASPTDLSPRQWEVVRRLADGERVTRIAAAMFVSPSTIRNHLSAIYAKVGVHSQDELVSLLRQRSRLATPSDRPVTKQPSSA